MRIDVQVVGRIDDVIDVQAGALSDALRSAITTASTRLRDRLRAQVRAAGLGSGLERAWRSQVYPQRRVRTFRPAALVYSKAQLLHQVFEEGASVRAARSRFLVIPTQAGETLGLGQVRSSRKGGAIPGRATRRYADLGAFADRIGAEVTSVARAGSNGGDGSSHRRGAVARIVLHPGKGGSLVAVLYRRGRAPVAIAILKPMVRIAKRLDINGAARQAESDLASLIEAAS